MPALDINFLKKLTPQYKEYTIFVETGTLHGKTIENLAPYFNHLHTIEVFEPNYNISKENLKNIPNVKQYLGDSSIILPQLCKTLESSCIFFLDGHWSSGNTGFSKTHVPLYSELEGIMKNMNYKCLIVIDDVRLFGNFDGPCDWTNINKIQVLNAVKTRMKTYYYLPSRFHHEDRLIIELSPIPK
tara:strand:+ start:46 stop:603 length:558 start_codon:yes stop_codon:yes gene_type:complete